MDCIIVSRHPAALDFLASLLDISRIPILTQAGPGDVRGKIVYGNLPLHLAALAAEVWAIEFDGAPPRGQEYSLADMVAAGARLVPYVVVQGRAARGE